MSVIYEFTVRVLCEELIDDTASWAHHIKRRVEEGNNYLGVDVAFVGDKPLSSPKWPFDITDDQKSSLWRKWRQENNDLTFQEFVESIQPSVDGSIVVQWAGMYLQIEKNGYTHS
jgi:hypothetical protein